jgi:hypothetical protein
VRRLPDTRRARNYDIWPGPHSDWGIWDFLSACEQESRRVSWGRV